MQKNKIPENAVAIGIYNRYNDGNKKTVLAGRLKRLGIK